MTMAVTEETRDQRERPGNPTLRLLATAAAPAIVRSAIKRRPTVELLAQHRGMAQTPEPCRFSKTSTRNTAGRQ